MFSKVQNGISQQNRDKLVKNIFLKYTCIFNKSQVYRIIAIENRIKLRLWMVCSTFACRSQLCRITLLLNESSSDSHNPFRPKNQCLHNSRNLKGQNQSEHTVLPINRCHKAISSKDKLVLIWKNHFLKLTNVHTV